MVKSTVRSILIIMGLGASVCAGAGPGSPRPNPPVIHSAFMDSAKHAMVVSGHHFGSTPPTVVLAHQVLQVKTSSENQLLVGLPEDIQPATYRLTVTTSGPYRLTSDVFYAALFAVAGR